MPKRKRTNLKPSEHDREPSPTEAKPYVPPIEIEAIEAYMAGLKKRSPRLKVTTDANNVTKIAPEHPDLALANSL